MKKYIIITACLALCAAVWPQSEMVEKTPTTIHVTAVSATEPIAEDIAVEPEITPPAEEKKAEIPQAEPLHEDPPEPEPVPEEVPVVAEVQSAPEPEPEPVSAPEPTPAPAPSQTVAAPQPSSMVYVPGFGWLECQGPGEVIHDESVYENGNKIGVMG